MKGETAELTAGREPCIAHVDMHAERYADLQVGEQSGCADPHDIGERSTTSGRRPRLTLNLATDGSMVLRPRRKYELPELVWRITTKNRQSETDRGPPAGRESW